MKRFFKIIGLVLGSLLLLYVLWLALSYWGNKGENEVFIVPNDFEGAVIVLFNEADGKAVKYDSEGNRVYEVPKSGVLKTQFKFQEGWRDIKYQKDNGKQIKYLLPSDKVWKDTINQKDVYAYGAGYANDYWFIIGKPKDSEYWAKIMSKKWEPYSETKTLKEGESTGKVRQNKLFDE